GTGMGFNLGVHYHLDNEVGISLSYRSKVVTKLEGGDAEFTVPSALAASFPNTTRSEEHTSELQSRENLVCRLLLEKKNNKNILEAVQAAKDLAKRKNFNHSKLLDLEIGPHATNATTLSTIPTATGAYLRNPQQMHD